ncbi:hypothetical protein F2P81_000287 [Scophthalmus maximus]|uniref:Uncharacterized protein n=1 Tax=Scophthalmus maximus TaxID=52904 RepID=A0A6A4TTX9_SCOMX|nr:hypothetical protein F2P81_000287 [Scophthalmus maximus]
MMQRLVKSHIVIFPATRVEVSYNTTLEKNKEKTHCDASSSFTLQIQCKFRSLTIGVSSSFSSVFACNSGLNRRQRKRFGPQSRRVVDIDPASIDTVGGFPVAPM